MDLTVILLVVVAVVSLFQAVLMVWLAIEGRRTLRGLERFADDLADRLSPVAANVAEAAGNAAAVSESALEHVQRLDTAVRGAAEAWAGTTERIHSLLTPNISRLAGVASAWRVFRAGWSVYRFLRRRRGAG
jgi:hypothetical protein